MSVLTTKGGDKTFIKYHLDLQIAKGNVKSYVYQGELGENGTPHVQGFFIATRKIRPMQLLPGFKCHWTYVKAPRNGYAVYAAYCQKEDTRAWPAVTKGELPKVPVEVQPKKRRYHEVLWKWQDWLKAELKTQWEAHDERTINWVWERKGKFGKSAFVRHMAIEEGALVCGGRVQDVKHVVAAYYAEKKETPKYILWDVSRDQMKNVSYGGMEEIKNGTFCATKYESASVILDEYPVICCFANFEPETSKLSADRWNVINARHKAKELDDQAVPAAPATPATQPMEGGGGSKPSALDLSVLEEEYEDRRGDEEPSRAMGHDGAW